MILNQINMIAQLPKWLQDFNKQNWVRDMD